MEKDGFHTVRGYQLMDQSAKITSAMEDYLEMIVRNRDKTGIMRVNQLAELLNVRASSATKMVQKLGVLGFLQYEKYGVIMLTNEGCELGEYLLRRHRTVESFLRLIGTENLLIETELIEHNISPDTLRYIEILNDFFQAHPDIAFVYNQYRRSLP